MRKVREEGLKGSTPVTFVISSKNPEMEVTIHKLNIAVLLHETSKMCIKLKIYCKIWNNIEEAGTAFF